MVFKPNREPKIDPGQHPTLQPPIGRFDRPNFLNADEGGLEVVSQQSLRRDETCG